MSHVSFCLPAFYVRSRISDLNVVFQNSFKSSLLYPPYFELTFVSTSPGSDLQCWEERLINVLRISSSQIGSCHRTSASCSFVDQPRDQPSLSHDFTILLLGLINILAPCGRCHINERTYAPNIQEIWKCRKNDRSQASMTFFSTLERLDDCLPRSCIDFSVTQRFWANCQIINSTKRISVCNASAYHCLSNSPRGVISRDVDHYAPHLLASTMLSNQCKTYKPCSSCLHKE